jgi:uncharacterized GH25 family protein/DNA-binding beta-propeller fold protein YncE
MSALFARSACVPRCASPRRYCRPLGLSLAMVTLCSLLPAQATAQTKESTASTPPPAKAPVAAKTSTLTLHCFLGRSRQPLDGVDIEFRARLAGDSKQQWVHADARGVAVLEWPADKKVEGLWFTARKPKFVPMEYWWDSQNGEPNIPSQMELRFERGHQIGGVVRDESGRPVAGVRLQFNMPVAGVDHRNGVFTAGDAFTDDQGRWKWSEAPADCSGVNVQIRHFDYLRQWTQASQSREMVFVLKRGLELSGRVVGPAGKPVAGARVALGFERWDSEDSQARTSSDGQFTLRNCKPGRSLVTVQAAGFSPTLQEVEVAKGTKALDLRLEPGHTVKIRVVDSHGKPLANAAVWVGPWRGHRVLDLQSDTDANGETVWDSAPADTMMCRASKEGYMSSDLVPIKASNDFQVMRLAPELVISGRVADASTGRPIKDFQIRQGLVFANYPQIFWQRFGGAEYENGRYRFKMRQQQNGVALKVIAKGYKPARSRTFHVSEGSQAYDFSLQPGKGPSGVVVRPDATPISGVDVALATEDGRVSVTEGRFDRNQNAGEMTKTDARGRFEFLPLENDQYVVIALSDDGFAEASADQVQQRMPLRLRPWGRLKGRVLLGHKPDAGRQVSYTPQLASRGSFAFYVWNFRYQAQTDQQGRFEFDRVMPGPGTASRIVIREFDRGQQQSPGWTVPVDIREGRTTEVTIGGTGRLVVGKARLKGTPERPVSWSTNEPVMITAWDKTRNTQAQPAQRYVGTFLGTGEFRAPDVPAGDYKLTLQIDGPRVGGGFAGAQVIGEGAREFTIPPVPNAAESETPFDLGEVTATLYHKLSPGEWAPDFVAERLDRGTVRLADFRGKLLLMIFWTARNDPSLAELEPFQAVHERFGKNPRFAQLGLACGMAVADLQPLIEKQKGMNWLQARVGYLRSRVPRDYTVRAVPTTFLIGPDGHVLASNLKGEKLEQVIAVALQDDKLFAAVQSGGTGPPIGGSASVTATQRPARFPVARLTDAPVPNSSESPRLASPPAVVALCDTDPSLGKDRPHDDRLLLLTATGSELWSHGGLATSQTNGGGHAVVIDRARARIYVGESLADRITAFNLAGQQLWQIAQIPVNTLAIDPQTGNLWTSGGEAFAEDGIVVFDPQGREVTAFPYAARDIAYNPHDDAFWLAGRRILKLNRKGDVLFQKPLDGWGCISVATNPTDGTVWIAEGGRPQIRQTKNRLWPLASDGTVRHKIELGDYRILAVACSAKTGEAWIAADNQGIRRVSADGIPSAPLPVAGQSLSISPTSGEIWLGNKDAILRLDPTGKVLAKSPFAKPCLQSWLEAW